jgi:hypothetical protein
VEVLDRFKVDYRVEDGIGFHSVAIVDLIISICFTVDLEPFQCVHRCSL